MNMLPTSDELLGTIITLIRLGEEDECRRLIQAATSSERNELRDTASRLRSLTCRQTVRDGAQ